MKDQKGITLVALVVTIIVLLILAGVTIALVLGQNGIFTKANTASEETFKSDVDSIVKLAVLNYKVNSYSNNGAAGAVTAIDAAKAAATELTANGYTPNPAVPTTATFAVTKGTTTVSFTINDDLSVSTTK